VPEGGGMGRDCGESKIAVDALFASAASCAVTAAGGAVGVAEGEGVGCGCWSEEEEAAEAVEAAADAAAGAAGGLEYSWGKLPLR
jgi:hypothetical protein